MPANRPVYALSVEHEPLARYAESRLRAVTQDSAAELGRAVATARAEAAAVAEAAAAAAVSAAGARAAAAEEKARAAVLDASSARRLQLASVILLSTADDMDPSTRAAAAAELVTLHLPQSREILIDAMGTDRIDVLQAVLESMLAESDVNEAYGPSLLALVESAPIEVRPVLAELLARHGQIDVRILPALSMLAADQTKTVEQREAAILAIGAFRHASAIAASELMMILQQPHAADDPITLAAREQLSRLTGMPRSTTAAQWIAWWKENRNRPSERWLEDTVDALTKQSAARIKELSEVRAARDRMSARLLTAYRDFWPLLTIEQQQARLLPLLQDELPSVRVFGLGRLAIQLRDGHDTPGGQEAAAVLLAAPTPSVRAAVATLIPELDPATIDPAVIERFYAETNAAVLAAMLPRIAAIQPNLITAEKVTPLLSEPTSRAAAINAMWTVLSAAGQTDQDRADALLPAVRKAFELEQTPQAGALLTLIGSPSDVAMLEVRLDDDDSNWQPSAGSIPNGRSHGNNCNDYADRVDIVWNAKCKHDDTVLHTQMYGNPCAVQGIMHRARYWKVQTKPLRLLQQDRGQKTW